MLIRQLVGRGEIFTCRHGDSVMAAAKVLHAKRIGAMPVVDEAHGLIGMLSERDIVRALVEREGQVTSLLVSDVMSRTVITCAPGNTVVDAAALMHRYSIRHLPIVEDEMLVGMLSLRDVLKLVEPAESRAMLFEDQPSR